MKNRIMSIIILTILTVTLSFTAQASTLYTVGYDVSNNYEFGSVDTVTKQYQVIKSLGTTMYSNLASQGNGSFYIYENGVGLKTISTNGSISDGKTITNFTEKNGPFTPYGMAYRSLDQKIYAYEYTTNSFGSIDSLGAWSELAGTTGYSANYYGNFAGRLAIHNDALYGAIGDLTSADAGFFNTISYAGATTNSVADIAFFDMVLASDGTNLYGITGSGPIGFVGTPPPLDPYTNLLYTISPNGSLSSTASPLVNMPYALTGVAAVGTPEPSTYILLMIALGAVGFARKKMND